MDALVTAGGIPAPDEPLYLATQGKSKALMDVAGKPMAQWVLDALGGSSRVDRVVLVGLEPDCGLTCAKPMHFLSNQGAMLANIQAGLKAILDLNPGAEYVLAVSSDIPAITAPMIDWTVDTTMQTDYDLHYLIVERSVMETRFPGSRRSYVRLKEGEFCGGDMNVIRSRLAGDQRLWERIVAARKNALKQAALVGLDVLGLVMIHQLTLDGAGRRISRTLGLKGHAIPTPYAEIAMDIDKPHQLEILRQDLAARHPAAA
jgi:GTP:adenosylcobinamide-phosphate guanylyltransferase